MKAAGGFGSRWMTDLINNIVKEGYIPDDWRKSILVPVYKGKGDPLVCGSYRAIKLLEQPMKVLERVLEKRIRCQVSIDNMQFGFMPGKGTTDAIFIMRQVQEKHQAKKKKLYYAFVDLEKAFDRVPREVVRWALQTENTTSITNTQHISTLQGSKNPLFLTTAATQQTFPQTPTQSLQQT